MKDFYIKEKQKYFIYKYNKTLGGTDFLNQESESESETETETESESESEYQSVNNFQRRKNNIKIKIYHKKEEVEEVEDNNWKKVFSLNNKEENDFQYKKNQSLEFLQKKAIKKLVHPKRKSTITDEDLFLDGKEYIGILKYKNTKNENDNNNIQDYNDWIRFYNEDTNKKVKSLIDNKVLHDTYIEIIEYNSKYYLFEYSKILNIFDNEIKNLPENFIIPFLKKVFAIYNKGFRLNDLELRNLVHDGNDIYFIDWFDLLSDIFDPYQKTIKYDDFFVSNDTKSRAFKPLYEELKRVLEIVGITLSKTDINNTKDETIEYIDIDEMKDIIKKNIKNIFEKLNNNNIKINKNISYEVQNMTIGYANMLSILSFIEKYLIIESNF